MLTGRLVEGDWGWGNKEVGWVRLNTLAHADWATLGDLADGSRGGTRSPWDGALMFLAGELISAGGSSEGVDAVQRGALIPLELDLLAASSPALSTPSKLVDVVRQTLARATRDVHLPTGRPRRTKPS